MIDRHAEPVAALGERSAAASEGAGLVICPVTGTLGLRPKTPEGWEVDQAEPSTILLGRIATVTGVSQVWLLTGQGTGSQDAGAALRAELVDLQHLLAEAAVRVDHLEEALSYG